MSDSEVSTSIPSDAKIERAVRDTVIRAFKSDETANLTVKTVRNAVEKELGLPDNYLKTNAKWSAKSKEVITAEVEKQQAGADSDADVPAKPASKQKAAAAKTKPKAAAPKKDIKRKAEAKQAPRKRRKVSVSSEEESEMSETKSLSLSENESDVSEPVKRSRATASRKSRNARAVVESDDDAEEPSPPSTAAEREETAQPESKNKDLKPVVGATEDADKGNQSDSSALSSVIDEPVKKKPRQKKATSEKASNPSKLKAKTTSKPAKAEKELDPDDAEIKRLQGWLLKCGIRRLWGKELKPYDTSKAKINHLKQMLKDVGMDGRYSEEKAKKIKEQRELAAELDAVQEGAKRWGQSEEEDEDQVSEGRPRRRLAKGLQQMNFLDSEGDDSD